jgi:integrase
MASLEFIRYAPRRPEVLEGKVLWNASSGRLIERLPQLIWSNQTTWGEANLWALEQATTQRKDIKTVQSAMSHLLGYANWLEAEGIEWFHFPQTESERCLSRFRGALVRARDHGEIAPSTASARMAAVVRFYRWVKAKGLLTETWPMWSERQIGIRLTDSFGFNRTMVVQSTDLAIPNRRVAGALQLEDGVMPLTSEGMQQVIEFADEQASEELVLMLRTGVGTGLRLGSILDLRLGTLDHACIDLVAGWYRIAVGPAAKPPVSTKYGISGMVPIVASLLEQLRAYACSTRRLLRQAKAAPEHRDLLFLTRFGTPYSGTQSRAINVEMSRLRSAGISAGYDVFREFHFHRTRATFATMLMRAALASLPVADAVQFVREACLHKDEATTMKYVKFIEVGAAMAEAADAFTEAFMGLAQGRMKCSSIACQI